MSKFVDDLKKDIEGMEARHEQHKELRHEKHEEKKFARELKHQMKHEEHEKVKQGRKVAHEEKKEEKIFKDRQSNPWNRIYHSWFIRPFYNPSPSFSFLTTWFTKINNITFITELKRPTAVEYP